MSELDRRGFLKVAGVGAGALLSGVGSAPGFVTSGLASANVVVIGGGSWGTWTALNLRRRGAKVTLIDMYGPGNSRATSGDESRGVRSSYGDRVVGEQWMKWARLAMDKWKKWDEEYAKPLRMQLFFTTGDLIMRTGPENFTTRNREMWEKHKIPHEVLTAAEVHKRWPGVFGIDDIGMVLYEPDAGVVRARRSCEAVAEVFRHEGGKIVIERVVPPEQSGFDGSAITLENGTKVGGDVFVFCVGPWLGKTFDLMKNRMRTPLGQVFYYGTPPGDTRFLYPNLPSWNFPGVTGWGGIPTDNRGFRVRGGGGGGGQNAAAAAAAAAAAGANGPPAGATPPTTAPTPTTPPAPPANVQDPDLSSRHIDDARLPRQQAFLATRFPLLKDAPVLATHACHYEQSASRNFIIDKHPTLKNIWVVGGGNAEGLKFGPVIGEYACNRILGRDKDDEFAKQFAFPPADFDPNAQRRPGTNGEADEEY